MQVRKKIKTLTLFNTKTRQSDRGELRGESLADWHYVQRPFEEFLLLHHLDEVFKSVFSPHPQHGDFLAVGGLNGKTPFLVKIPVT